jgi:hypothetical protein
MMAKGKSQGKKQAYLAAIRAFTEYTGLSLKL